MSVEKMAHTSTHWSAPQTVVDLVHEHLHENSLQLVDAYVSRNNKNTSTRLVQCIAITKVC
jgi:hypothetical protein